MSRHDGLGGAGRVSRNLDDYPDVLFTADLAALLGSSDTTIKRNLARARLHNDWSRVPPPMRKHDRKPRWFKTSVIEWMAVTEATPDQRSVRFG